MIPAPPPRLLGLSCCWVGTKKGLTLSECRRDDHGVPRGRRLSRRPPPPPELHHVTSEGDEELDDWLHATYA